jgi:hypothetical protein
MFEIAIQPGAVRAALAKKTARNFQAELDDIERQIAETNAPAEAVEAEIGRIRAALERGRSLSASDPAEFVKQGGDNLLAELSDVLERKLLHLETIRREISNLQEPLQITKSNLLAFLAKRREKSQIRKEREELRRVRKESPINLFRWVSRVKTKPTIWKVVAMAQRREDQVLNEICDLYHLKIVSKKDLSDHYARKYANFRLKLYRRGFYLIPDDKPKGRETKENEHEISTKESE